MSTATRLGALRFDERPDVGDAKGSEELLALRRSKPMTLVLYVAVAGSRWACASSAVCHYIASVRDFPANPRDRVYEPYAPQRPTETGSRRGSMSSANTTMYGSAPPGSATTGTTTASTHFRTTCGALAPEGNRRLRQAVLDHVEPTEPRDRRGDSVGSRGLLCVPVQGLCDPERENLEWSVRKVDRSLAKRNRFSYGVFEQIARRGELSG
jgi:hypothetical protein